MLPLPRAARQLLAPFRRAGRSAEWALRTALGLTQSDESLVRDAETLWRDDSRPDHGHISHWRGSGVFGDDRNWLALGREHLQLFRQFARMADFEGPIDCIVEWGCGGGANAVHFAPLCRRFVGVDISRSSLDECARQVGDRAATGFDAVLIDAARPEAAVDRIGHCDAFVSFYVFELLPTPEYGLRVLGIAHRLLREGGMAVIQIKYSSSSRWSLPRRWNYAGNLAHNVTYRIEEFWQATERAGFRPLGIVLRPKVDMLDDERYAYVAMTKAGTALAHESPARPAP